MLLARFAGAALLSAAYVVAVYLAAYAITEATGHWRRTTCSDRRWRSSPRSRCWPRRCSR
jgi:hypothetical protein